MLGTGANREDHRGVTENEITRIISVTSVISVANPSFFLVLARAPAGVR